MLHKGKSGWRPDVLNLLYVTLRALQDARLDYELVRCILEMKAMVPKTASIHMRRRRIRRFPRRFGARLPMS